MSSQEPTPLFPNRTDEEWRRIVAFMNGQRVPEPEAPRPAIERQVSALLDDLDEWLKD